MLGMKLGLSPAAGIFQGANEIWRWTPAQLFAGGVAGFWPARFDPAGQKLWQDAIASARALVAGGPVGKVERAFGTVDAAQATALSRPALGRWPKGAKPRNLLRGSQGAALAAWQKVNGVTATLSTTERAPNGEMAVEVTFPVVGASFRQDNPSTVGKAVTSYFWIKGTAGQKIGVTRNTSDPITLTGDWELLSFHYTVGDSGRFAFETYHNGITDKAQTIYIAGCQVELGTIPSPIYQPTDADGVPLAGYGQVRNLLGYTEVRPAGYDPVISGAWTSSGASLADTTETYNGLRGVIVKSTGQTWHRVQGAGVNQFNAVAGEVYNVMGIAKPIDGNDSFRVVFRNETLSKEAVVRAITTTGVTVVDSTTAGTISNIALTPLGSGVYSLSFSVTLAENGRIKTGIGPNSVTDGVGVIAFAMQCERGSVATPLQYSFGPNNVTEQGVEDVWFLVNDGNDALPVSLPAGTYGIAYVNPAGGISYATQTLASEGTIDALRGTRMADVIIRQGDFTAAEKALIEAEWSKIAV